VNRNAFLKTLSENGWAFLREGGSHTVYVKKGFQFVVPRHRQVSPGVVGSWKKLNQKIDEED
jgi:predicted RNA binding protein YcfA (HicA-like mRNA interferase family)